MMKTVVQIKCICLITFCILCFAQERKREDVTSSSTDLANGPNDRLLLFSTLDGSFIGVEQQTGHIRWKHKNEPTVKVPIDTSHAINPIILPDPKDGSLYLLKNADSSSALKKLPFTIPELVASAPCRSSDGILYTGKKVDQWFLIEPQTGRRESVLGWGGNEQTNEQSNTCPLNPNQSIYVGRTQYEVMMIDGRQNAGQNNRKWNVTFIDYTSTTMSKEKIKSYGLIHFAASSTGLVVTLERETGHVLWQTDLGSPAVAAYISSSSGLLSIPLTSLAHNTLETIAKQSSPQNEMRLYPTLYVGEHNHGLYALPSLVDQNTVIISASQSDPLLIDGPAGTFIGSQFKAPLSQFGQNFKLPSDHLKADLLPVYHTTINDKMNIIILGYYKVPDYSETRLQIEGRNDPIIPPLKIYDKDTENDSGVESTTVANKAQLKNTHSDKYDFNLHLKHPISVAVQTEEHKEVKYDNEEHSFLSFCWFAKDWIYHQDNMALKLIVLILIGCMVTMFWYLNAQVRGFKQLSQGSKDFSNGSNVSITAIPEELREGKVRVGKIIFYPEEILGRGCEGTFVYRGEFEGRSVAVKRLLPECFSLADREVSLLRESDAHPHVIRYHCTERDRQFRYIALELCVATLYDYITSPQSCYIDLPKISNLDILKQATAGLGHLHSLDIVHRDIKPQNVLLWVGRGDYEVKALISDFGLCKKLQYGRTSFSRRSGLTGTDGWIAPEMIQGNYRTTTAVDIFSLGCVFYFVLSNGKHPFGEPLRRQANILSETFKLSELPHTSNINELAQHLIKCMIKSIPHLRPPATAIEKHPLFWSRSKVLNFFQDVSDRIEKSDKSDPVLLKLESYGRFVVREDWRLYIDSSIASDLRKFRSYRGDSVRDLLRALRNKKHHYRELSPEIQASLGDIPDSFTEYWTARFPLLLIHAWLAIQFIRNEPIFKQYYHEIYEFPEQNDSTYFNFCVNNTDLLYAKNKNSLILSTENLETSGSQNDILNPVLSDNDIAQQLKETGNFKSDINLNAGNLLFKSRKKNSPKKMKKQLNNNYVSQVENDNNDGKKLSKYYLEKLNSSECNNIDNKNDISENTEYRTVKYEHRNMNSDVPSQKQCDLNYDWRSPSKADFKIFDQHQTQKANSNKLKRSQKRKNNEKPISWTLPPT